MKTQRWWALAIVGLLPLAACETEVDQTEELGVEETAEMGAMEETGTATAWNINQYDTDADQQLARNEWDTWYSENNLYDQWNTGGEGLEQNEFSQGVFETWDANDDAGLDETEWNDGTGWFDGQYGTFGEWDANGDSVLDANEVAEGFETNNLYDTVDRDSDALIDDEEIADWWFDIWDADDSEYLDTTEWDNLGAEYTRLGLS